MIGSQSRDSARMVRTKRSAWAFACGARIGVWMTSIPSLRKTWSKALLNLLVAVVDQEPHPLEQARGAEVARLLGHRGAARIGGAARQVHAAACEFDAGEQVEAAQRDRLDGEEVAGEHAGGLLTQELLPARPRAPRRRPKPVGKQDAPDRARRDTQAQLQQLAADPRVAPARVLPCEAQSELADAIIDGRPARAPGRLLPLATHKLPMPAQKRLWRHDPAAPACLRQDSRKRGKEGTISGAQRRTPLLSSEHDQLMPQHEQLDIFGELAAPTAHQQPQHS